MALEVGTAFIPIKPDLGNFQRDVSRQVDPAIDRTGKSIRTGIGGAFRSVAAIAGGLFVGMQAFNFLGDSLAEARDAARVGRETAAVLKSTGQIAGISRKQVERYGKSIGRLVGVDNDVIQDGENLLLTFTKIGKDIFPDATQAAVDMTAALNDGKVTNETLQANVVRLGRALQDPVKGLTALGRAGVNVQGPLKDTVTQLVAAGDTAGAQRAILEELGKEFGGVAAASADAGTRFNATMQDIKERIGNVLLPAISGIGTAFTTIWDVFDVAGADGVIAVIKNWIDTKLKPWLTENVPKFLHWLWDTTVDAVSAGVKFLGWLGTWVTDTAIPWLQTNVPKFIDWLFDTAQELAMKGKAWLDTSFKPWIDDTLKPWLQENVPNFLDFYFSTAATVWSTLATKVGEALGKILDGINSWLDNGGAERFGETAGKAYAAFINWFWVEGNGPKLVAALVYFVGRIVIWLITEGMPKLLEAFYKMAFGAVKGFVDGFLDRMLGRNGQKGVLQDIIDTVRDNLGNWAEVGAAWAGKVWDGFVKWVKDHAGPIGDVIGKVIGAVLPGGDGWGIEGASRAGGGHSRLQASPSGSTTAAILKYAASTPVIERPSSTFRPGAITRSGHQSYHSVGRAVDFVGPNLMAIFQSFLPIAGQLKELIYGRAPFNIKNGQRVRPYAVADHLDHVHVALAKGGIVTQPTVALMGESGAEAVLPLTGGGGLKVHVYLGTREIEDLVDVRIDGVSREAEDMLLRGVG
jgi:hypothetical protein